MASSGPDCTVESCGGDPATDRWTIGLWSATADLLACCYAYAEEGAYDGGGRWRRRQIHHYLAGRAADRVRARGQAAHFCDLVRQLARAHAKARGGSAHVRRGFEHGCGDRLVVRLRLAASAQRSSENGFSPADEADRVALLRGTGLVPRACPPPPDRSADDRAAARAGKAAADNISLVLRTGSAHAPIERGERQISMF